MPKKKSIRDLLEEKATIERQIAALERDQTLRKLTESPEFRAIADRVAELKLSDEEIVSLFAQRRNSTSKTRKRSSQKKGTATALGTYQHPEDPSVTWSGRGRKPSWIIEWIESGKPIEELRKE